MTFNRFLGVFINLMEVVYKLIFKREPSPKIRNFFGNLTKVTIASFVAAILTFTFNALAGRLAGPEEYGYFQILQSIVAIISIPMTIGLSTSILNYNSRETSEDNRSAIISHIYLLIITYVLIASFIYLIFFTPLQNLFHVSQYLFITAILFAVIFTFFSVMNSTMTSFHHMGKYASYQVLTGIIMLISLLTLLYLGFFSFMSMVISLSLAYLIIIILVLKKYYKYIKFKFNRKLGFKLAKYGFYSSIGGLACALYGGVDLIFINTFLNASSAGIYSVYKYASIGLGGMLFVTFNTVFFPWITTVKNKNQLVSDINHILPYLLLAGIPFAFILEFVIFQIFGSKYPFEVILGLLFALVFVFMIINNLYAWLLSSGGIKGAKMSSFSAVILAISNILLNWILIPYWGMLGGVVSLIISYFIAVVVLYLKRNIIWDS